jgi:FkbM family methyltransferase
MSAAGITYPYIEHFNHNGIKFDYYITDSTYRDWYNPIGHAQWHETRGYFELLSPGDSVLEVGCNNGFTMCIIKSITGPSAKFVGMDIVPMNCQIAHSQIGLNVFQNCQIKHCAASDRRGSLTVVNTNNGYISDRQGTDTIIVDAMPCDELLETDGYFDVLKIDVEGYEATVLKGCHQLLTHKPKLIIELHGQNVRSFGSTYAEIFDLIDAGHYQGKMCLRADNELRGFDPASLIVDEPHATVFLKPIRP